MSNEERGHAIGTAGEEDWSMTHWKKMMDKPYVGAWDLPEGKDTIVTIVEVVQGELHKTGSKKEKKPLLKFKNVAKPMVANATNCKTIAAMYGEEVESWIGKRIALFVTQTTDTSGNQVSCIRVRPRPPEAKRSEASEPEPEPAHD